MNARLTIRRHTVTEVVLGNRAAFEGGVLHVDRAALADEASCPEFETVTVDVAHPGESCRITAVFDVAAPYAKLDGSGDFPGVLSRIETAGRGTATTLDGCVVSISTDFPERASETIDMSGVAAELGAFDGMFVVAITTKRSAETAREEYLRACKVALLRVARRLALICADSIADHTDVVGSTAPKGLPRVAAVTMLHSHQVPSARDEPILYGDNVRGLLPVLLHPAEVIDGAVLAGYWSFNLETYHIQRRSLVHELLRRDGTELELVGVVATVAYDTNEQRERSTTMAASLLEQLGVDGAILTKVGGGIPQTDLMMTCDRAAERGIPSVVLTVEAIRGARPGETLSVFSPRADALVSAGGHDVPVDAPAVERVIGPPRVYAVAERTGNPVGPEAGTPATDAQPIRISEIAGATSQLGGTTLRSVSA